MMASEQDKGMRELNRFLSKVNDVESIVRGLQSQDIAEQDAAMVKADEFLEQQTTTAHNRTQINKTNNCVNTVPPDPGGGMFGLPRLAPDDFMKGMEADANRRAEMRKERHKSANVIKEKANVAFKDGNYETALWLYSEAIEIARDIAPLYTNRGMTNIKIGRYEDAIEDSNMALRIDPTWIKSFIVKGNALRQLKRYDEAIASYKKILLHNKEKEKLVNEYVQQVEEEKKDTVLEERVKQEVEENSPTAKLICRLVRNLGTRLEVRHESKENRHVYYAGGFRLLAAQLTDDYSRTLFRTEGGFKILEAKSYMRDVLVQKTFAFGQQSDFACAVLICLQAACSQCPKNTLTMFSEPLMKEIMWNLFESDDKQVKHAAIVCFYEFASNDKMIEMICDLYTVPKIVEVLLGNDTIKLKLLDEAMLCLLRYAENKRFRQDIVPVFDSLVLQVIQKFIDEIKHNQRKELPKCLQCLFLFTANKLIYQMVAANQGFWESCLACIDRCIHVMDPNAYRDEILTKLLDITEALMMHKTPATMELSSRLSHTVLPVINSKNAELVLKGLVVLTRCLERSIEAVKSFNSSGLIFVKKIYKLIKSDNPSTRTHALKVICYLGQGDPTLLRNVPKFDKHYNVIRRLLKLDETEIDVINQGHAAILLGFMAQVTGGMDPLVEYCEESSNIVKLMLDLCRYSKNSNTRYNCAIALGKMAQGDTRVLVELRRFDGINILSKNKPPDV